MGSGWDRRACVRGFVVNCESYQQQEGSAESAADDKRQTEGGVNAQEQATENRSEHDSTIHGRPCESIGPQAAIFGNQIGDHGITRNQEQRPTESCLDDHHHGKLPERLSEGQSLVEDQAGTCGDHQHHTPAEAVGHGAAEHLDR